MSSKEFNNPRYKGGGGTRSPPPNRSPPQKAPPPSYPKAKPKPGRVKSRPKSKPKALDTRMTTVFQDVHQAIKIMDAPSRQSKRYRPKLPQVGEIETNNPLYRYALYVPFIYSNSRLTHHPCIVQSPLPTLKRTWARVWDRYRATRIEMSVNPSDFPKCVLRYLVKLSLRTLASVTPRDAKISTTITSLL